MLSVFVCEDNTIQRNQLDMIVHSYIVSKDCDLQLTLSTDNPTELLDYLERHPQQNSLYILDVDLQHDINGIVLASKIREKDAHGKIIFVTAHDELSYLTFQYKVEALDYIVKDHPKNIIKRVWECIDLAYSHHLNDTLLSQNKYYQVKTNYGVRNIPFDEIMFFESIKLSHKLVLHTKNSRIEFYGSLSDITEISPDFYRSHKSFVININNVMGVYKAEQKIEMANGEFALITAKKIRGLLDAMQKTDEKK